MDDNKQNNGGIPIKKEIKLNDKQKAFVKKFVLSGGKATDSYMSVYKVFKKGVAAASVNRLLKSDAVQAAIQEELLNLKTLEKVDRFWIVQKLKALAEKSEAEDNHKYLIESLDMLNKMEGFYQTSAPAPTTVQGNMNILFGNFDPNSNQMLPPAPIQQEFGQNDIMDVDYNDLDENEEDNNLF